MCGAAMTLAASPNGLEKGSSMTAPSFSTICVLDDNLPSLRATRRLLNSDGWDVETFTDPAAFIDYVRTHQPAVAVIDMVMPVMNGLQVQSRLRDVSPNTRVIILTSADDPSIARRAVESGAFGFFRKPVDPEDFLARVASALNGSF